MIHKKYGSHVVVKSYSPHGPLRSGANDYQNIKSLESKSFDISKRATLYYTGDELIGIATIHKSKRSTCVKRQ